MITVAALSKSWTARVAASLAVDMGNCVVRIHTNHPPLIKELSAYFRDFVIQGQVPAQAELIDIFAWQASTQPDPEGLGPFQDQPREGGKSGLKETFVRVQDGVVIRKVRTGMLYAVGEGIHHVIGPCMDNLPQVVNFANNRAIQSALHKGALLGHASALVTSTAQGPVGVAFAGFSGMGKSTLALHLMAAAPFRFVSNDRIMFLPRGQGLAMLGVAKHPRINPGTILHNPSLHAVSTAQDRERWSKMPVDELWELEEKYDGMVDTCFGPGRFELEAPLSAFVVLNWSRNGQTPQLRQVDLSQRLELLEAIRKSPGLFFSPAKGQPPYDGSVANYLAMLSKIRVYELCGGVDFAKAVDLVRAQVVEPQ